MSPSFNTFFADGMPSTTSSLTEAHRRDPSEHLVRPTPPVDLHEPADLPVAGRERRRLLAVGPEPFRDDRLGVVRALPQLRAATVADPFDLRPVVPDVVNGTALAAGPSTGEPFDDLRLGNLDAEPPIQRLARPCQE